MAKFQNVSSSAAILAGDNMASCGGRGHLKGAQTANNSSPTTLKASLRDLYNPDLDYISFILVFMAEVKHCWEWLL